MEIKDIKDIIRAIDSSNISEFEFQKGEIRILIKKNSNTESKKAFIESEEENKAVINMAEINETKIEKRDENIHIIKSPIVGTFYSAPSPDSKPYVTVGSMVKKGDVLCIIEAMKLMNEITSDIDGEIAEIYAANASFIEYGQPLFGIRKV